MPSKKLLIRTAFITTFQTAVEQMQELGLYVSIPHSEKETDHLFPEPGLFVINADYQVQDVDISNNPLS